MPSQKTLKQKIGIWLLPRLPVNSHVFNHIRLELNAWVVRTFLPLNPFYLRQISKLKRSWDLFINIGCCLNECYRCMQTDATLRIIVPDLELYIKAYLAEGWELFNQVGCGGDKPQEAFKTKMDALNHVFVQGWEHYGGYDAENLEIVLREAGFTQVKRVSWRNGDFPVECIDREQHRPYSLYFEAQK